MSDEKIEPEKEPVPSEGHIEGEVAPKPVDDRPAINWQKELERKNREIERLRQEAEYAKQNSVQKRDQFDMGTWADHELKAIVNSQDPSTVPYKDQANDILLERKVKSIREKERLQEKRALADVELRSKYPEALDPTSEFASQMEQVMYDFDLQKSPAGRLAAARIVAAERVAQNKPKAEKSVEENRIKDIKAQMVNDDRPKPSGVDKPKTEDLVRKVNSKNMNESAAAMSDLLKTKGLSHDSFFKK